ncbi:MAG TPA: peptidylprolyl isomerase [Candidatus Dormibacteraeota bacterium]|jgi:cyclophilin family peptidyl-prolyl cis-trans isomerase|nr:peptidylprolyl isomerase [Candidatus Dormibacteraeota bacterium]
MRPLPALAVSAVVIATVLAAGAATGWLLAPHPSGPFAGCTTAEQLAPGHYAAPPPMCIDPTASYQATIRTTKGSFTVDLLARSAPRTVNNFVVLAVHGYFDRLHFFDNRSWVIRTGDPLGDGRGGPGYDLPPERGAGGWAPGSLGMARFPDGRISGSQFFILKQAWPGGNPSLDYNRFGTVSRGLDVVDKLTPSDTIVGVQVRRA